MLYLSILVHLYNIHMKLNLFYSSVYNTTTFFIRSYTFTCFGFNRPSSGISLFAGNSFGNHVRWAPCHHGMARPQVADGGDALQLWREAVNILNKKSRTADKGWSSSLGVGRGANNSSP
jgi:hypothetical protein